MHTIRKERRKKEIWFGTMYIKFYYISVHTPAAKLVDVNNIFRAC